MERVTKDEYYMGIAREVAARSTCLRRQHGAIIVRDDEIVSTGYNGAPRGERNCTDIGTCWRMANNIPHGQRYEACRSVHAEQNAIISAARRDMMGGTIYVAALEDGEPVPVQLCDICRRLIKNAGLKYVILELKDHVGVRKSVRDDL